MMRIKTNLKDVNFKSYSDLLKYMQEEQLKTIEYEVYLFYLDNEPIIKMSLHTIEEVQQIIKDGRSLK
jgi:hypothetical protein